MAKALGEETYGNIINRGKKEQIERESTNAHGKEGVKTTLAPRIEEA